MRKVNMQIFGQEIEVSNPYDDFSTQPSHLYDVYQQLLSSRLQPAQPVAPMSQSTANQTSNQWDNGGNQ